MFKLKSLLFLAALAFLTSSCAADENAPLFPFNATGEQIARIWNSPTLAKPAGADGLIRVENEHFVNDAGIVRFWGVNVCMGACFPEKETATAMAERLASFGLNIVRLHHMDMREIWGKNYPKQLEFDPEKLDRLDWFISELKRCGIYVNINLHVSRKFTEADGFPEEDLRPNHDKGLDHFMPRMIELQKKYARDLLRHVNPYTGKCYADEPCVAVVEINNENSIVSQWRGWALNRNLPKYCEEELQKQWNAWLRTKYRSTQDLRKAWGYVDHPGEPNQLSENDSTFSEGNPGKWILSQGHNSKASLQVKDGALVFEAQKIGEKPWEPQFFNLNVRVKKDLPYTVRFRARANKETKVTVGCVQAGPNWANLGLSRDVPLTTEWQDFELCFQGVADEENARVGFCYFEPGTVMELDDISFRAFGHIGIAEDESLENGTVRIANRGSDNRSTPAMRADFTQFCLDVEARYSAEMYDFVKNELKCQHPVTGTQLHYGSAYPQARMDYVDIHAYHNHPVFPHKAWTDDWYVSNVPLVNTLGNSGTLASLSAARVLGKPYTVSEYNPPFPNQYFAEGFPLIAAAGGFQDWAGIFIFGWTHSPLNPWHVSFFDIHGNSAALVHQPACHNLFVRGDVTSGLNAALETGKSNVRALSKDFQDQQTRDSVALNTGWPYSRTEADPTRTFTEYSGTRLTDLQSTENAQGTARLTAQEPQDATPEKPFATRSSTGELVWQSDEGKNGWCLIDTPRTKVFTGFTAQAGTPTFKDGTKIIPGASCLDWMTISMTQIDETDGTPSHRVLLAATGLVRNAGAKTRVYDEADLTKNPAELPDIPVTEMKNYIGQKLTTCRTNGGSPNLCEGISARIQLPAAKNVTVKFYPLTAAGERQGEFTARRVSDSMVELEISPEFRTLWYEIDFCADPL